MSRDVEVVVEVAAAATYLRELPGVLLIIWRDFLDWRTRDDDNDCVLVGEVS